MNFQDVGPRHPQVSRRHYGARVSTNVVDTFLRGVYTNAHVEVGSVGQKKGTTVSFFPVARRGLW